MLSWAVLINVSFHPLRYHWSFRRNTRLKIVFQTHWDSKYIFLLICVCYSYINTKQWSGILILKKSATYLQKQQDSRNLTFILCIYLWLWIQDTNQISSMEKKKCRLQNWFFFFKLASMLHTMWFASFFLPAHSLSECKEIQQYIAISASPKA